MADTDARDLHPWQRLLTSADMHSDLMDIYDDTFFHDFAAQFDRDPQPNELIEGVLETASSYINGKWKKLADKDKLLKYSGLHMINAGVAARDLSYALSQINKSKLASAGVQKRFATCFERIQTKRPHGASIHNLAVLKAGPQARLTMIYELAATLGEAIEDIISLPLKDDDEATTRKRALSFVADVNITRKKILTKNHAMEEAARAFRPLWERHSSVDFRRGRYRHEIGGYDCKAANALFAVISKLDPNVASSLAGTAIENVRKGNLAQKRSD